MIINTYDQLKQAVTDGIVPKKQAIGISYHPRERMHSRKWSIFSPFFQTDPDAHWTDYGCMVFIVGFEDKKSQLLAAQKWASEKYDIAEWKRNRMGDYVPAIVQDKLPIPKRIE